MSESRESWSLVVLLSHLEVFTEVLVSAPPVEVDHRQSLVSSHLMEVGISHVVLDTVHWETTITVHGSVHGVLLTNSPSPVVDHLLLLVLDENPEEETGPAVEDSHAPEESDTASLVEWLGLPVHVAERVLEEAGNVLERSPSLSSVTRLLGSVDKFAEIAISVLGKSSKKYKFNQYKTVAVKGLTCQSYRHAR